MVMNATGCRVGIRDRYGTLPDFGSTIGCAGGAGGKTGMSSNVQPLPRGGGVGRAAGAATCSVGAEAEAEADGVAPGGGSVAGEPAEQAARASPRRATTTAVRA